MALRQVHFRATEQEYQFLKRKATIIGDSVSTILRRIIRRAMSADPELSTTSSNRANTSSNDSSVSR